MYKVLYVEPLEVPRVIETDLSLESIHTLVQGDVFQAVYPWEDYCALLCSDTGKLDLLPPNRIIGNDIIAGPFLIVGLGEEDFTDLPEALIEKYSKMFAAIEFFIPRPDGIAVYKVEAVKDE